MICKRLRPALQFFKYLFDCLPIFIGIMLESEAVTATGRLQPERSISQREGVINEMLFLELSEEHIG